jgi:hypothetical protein
VQIGHFGHGLAIHHHTVKCKDDRKWLILTTWWNVDGVLPGLSVVEQDVPDFAARTSSMARTSNGEQKENERQA